MVTLGNRHASHSFGESDQFSWGARIASLRLVTESNDHRKVSSHSPSQASSCPVEVKAGSYSFKKRSDKGRNSDGLVRLDRTEGPVQQGKGFWPAPAVWEIPWLVSLRVLLFGVTGMGRVHWSIALIQ